MRALMLLTAVAVAAPAPAAVMFQDALIVTQARAVIGNATFSANRRVRENRFGTFTVESSRLEEFIDAPNRTSVSSLSRIDASFLTHGTGVIQFTHANSVDTIVADPLKQRRAGSARAIGEVSLLFSVDRPMAFSLDYLVSTTGEAADGSAIAQFASLERDKAGITDPVFASAALANGAKGRITARLDTGKYRLIVRDFAPASIAGAPGEQVTSSLGSRFAYSFAAVPEPASWAMMIAGFGLVGAAARRRTLAPQPA